VSRRSTPTSLASIRRPVPDTKPTAATVAAATVAAAAVAAATVAANTAP